MAEKHRLITIRKEPYPGISSSLARDSMLSAIEELQGFKDLIIAHNLSKHGIEIDFDAEARARFKKIVCESHAGTGEETYYYNDGTPEGLRIVTFKMDWPSFDSPMSGDSIKIGFTHY